MVNEEILGGLRSALARGQSLRASMMSFYNSGYRTEEIEEAAKALMAENQNAPPKTAPMKKVTKAVKPTKKPIAKPKNSKKVIPQKPSQVSSYGLTKSPNQIQKPSQLMPQRTQNMQNNNQNSPPQSNSPSPISSYGKQPKKPKGKILVYLIVFVLFLSVAGLISIIFFKEEFYQLLDKLLH